MELDVGIGQLDQDRRRLALKDEIHSILIGLLKTHLDFDI